jgi:simple sugar transport system ATP-binding protein
MIQSQPHDAQVTSGSHAAFLDVIDVHKRFDGVYALKGVSLQIRAGEVYHLLGENGCGKSTLIKIISGAQPADSGELIIDGASHDRLTPLAALAAGIQTVYQDLSLIPNLTVSENIGLTEQLVARKGRLARLLNRGKLAQTAHAALEAVGLPSDAEFQSTPVGALPIATRQLIAIARAVACRARMVIMDEPTTALTKREVEKLIAVVRELQRQGAAVLFVTHKLEECFAIGGEVIVFRDGQNIMQGPIANYTKAELARLMTGKHISDERACQTAEQGPVRLQARNLVCAGAFNNVSFELRAGEILGVTGLLDSGRNELALALAGIRALTGGTLRIDGREASVRSPRDAIALGMGYVPEDRLNEGLFLNRSIHENIVSIVLNNLRGRFGLINATRSKDLARSMVADLKIATPDIERSVQSLSGGNQQRVLIGRWLLIKPRVLILHGPTVGVDVGSKDTIYQIVRRLASDGLGVILISDDLPELLQNCSRILLMNKGALTACLNSSDVSEAELYRHMLSVENEAVAA